ncbi:MAG: hypothetical protein J6B92_08145 [Paraprevotella sp.]|nr:hypothetical protein [Paraprevotella sp.]
MTNEQIERTQKFLFADKLEMDEAGLPLPVQERLVRLRDIYNYWLRYNHLSDRDIVRELKGRYGVCDSTAYEDVRLIKVCLGNLTQCTREYDAYRLRCMVEETYNMAKRNSDAATMAKIASVFGKYARLDKEEVEVPDYSRIVPEQFEMSEDPTLIGIKRIPNWREKAKKLEKQFIQDVEELCDSDFDEIKPLEKTYDDSAY